LITSQGNAYHKLGKSSERIGGEFYVQHRQAISDVLTPQMYMTDEPVGGGSITRRFNGRFACKQADVGIGHFGWPAFQNSSREELEAFGTTAIANVEPTNPLSGLTVFLGELRSEGLPMIPGIRTWKDRTNIARSAGSEYLNKEFGWDPLIGDIRDFVRVSRNSDELIADYERGSGRKIHRRFALPTETTVTHSEGTGWQYLTPAVNSVYFVAPPKWSITTTIEKTRWFEGCFTYYLPPFDKDGSNFARNRQIAHKLYGASVTPETVWNLTPWTWAIDWFSNAGDVIHNISAFANNGLVMPYGYVMEKTVHREEVRVWDIRSKRSESTKYAPDGLTQKRTSCSSTLESITKQRIVATPYGFGLDFDGFSSFQLSILAALGLSRS
jgi:hypothetical protein